ncbi:hypothetical protein Raf01_45240 [Rugosimonospora africana]|uniref:NlpC/P60 family protein n=1 Tax=Rugosimonospora africana TaxID=556532 RepID=A0A8J3QUI9_9ACTN|nr:hypothetical protein Raf01_45240 [Rugosimonospora africana]
MTTGKLLGGIVAAILGMVVVCGLGAATLVDGGSTGCAVPMISQAAVAAPAGGWPQVGNYRPDQVALAAVIVSVGEQMGIPVRGPVIAVATAIQESDLTNPAGGDRDSVGLFQQRPSQGWGTPDQLHDPVYASRMFYARLQAIPGWQDMSLTGAAQAVQRSAYPDAYARWEPDATMLVDAVGSSNWRTIPGDLEKCPVDCPRLVNPNEQSSPSPGCMDGSAVLTRAATWVSAWKGGPVPYLSSSEPASWFHGYRRDCSGYVSMALGLAGPGLDTAGLAARSAPISKTDLRAGDLLINPTPDLAGHVVIFDHWTDPTMTSYLGYEQSGDGGTHHRVIPYPYFADYQMSPYRFLNR